VSQLGSVRVTVTVAVSPADAFDVFTDEIGDWYRTGVARLGGHRPAGTLRFEPGVGGRLVEDGPAPGRSVERARITVWAPGERLVFVDGRTTEVDVRFEPTPGGTRVVLEHRGLDRLAPDLADRLGRNGWRRLADWFEQHIADTTKETGSG
jgi:uncharacterized protein YndB with AHSA1/START domain